MTRTRSRKGWHYFRAGSVERGVRYAWRDGYARVVSGGVLYPWLTKREAQSAARKEGAQAVFHESEVAARAALAGGKSLIYLCAGCEQHYCATCDGGQDSCQRCGVGPLCNDCACEHDSEHALRMKSREGDEA